LSRMTLLKLTGVVTIRRNSTNNKPKTKRWLSPSSINSFIRCPRAFFYTRIAKLKQKPSIHLIRGIAVHSAIEKFYKYKETNIEELFKFEWEEQYQSLIETKLKASDIEFFYHESIKMLTNFFDDFLKNDGFNKPEPIIEKTFFSKKYQLLARLDKIEQARSPPLITDFKTSKSVEVTDDYKRQMGLCALLYEEAYRIRPKVEIHFLKFPNGKKRFRVSDKFLNEMKTLVAAIHRKTQSNDPRDYPCTCGYCSKSFINNS
jgi:CRISPR/Cas system-associated exonuclease Cas4 (RecB family)